MRRSHRWGATADVSKCLKLSQYKKTACLPVVFMLRILLTLAALIAAQPALADPPLPFWSLRPVADSAPPAVINASWAQNPIDRFILKELESRGLKPVELADKRTLIRRATYDLTGLPPTPDEIDAFLK